MTYAEISTGAPIKLAHKAGETLALAFHELATNAVKYGSLPIAHGMIRVSWDLQPAGPQGDRLMIRWDEERPGEPLGPPRRRGFGTELPQNSLAYELDAETRLDFRPDGLLCTVSMPFTRR